MPYKRSYTKKRYKRYKKPRMARYLGYAGSATSTAAKALSIAYGIKKLMNVEFKFHDVLNAITPSTTLSIQQLTNIPQGDTDITRDGAQVKCLRLLVRYLAVINASATTTFLRVMIIKDKQTNQAIYAAGDLLTDITATDAINSPMNLDNKYRFQVLYNRVHIMSITGANAAIKGEVFKDIDLKLRFDNSTPSIADLTSNSLSLVFISDQATNTPTVTFFSRLRYVDN